MQEREKEFKELEDVLFGETAALVSTKQGRARAETVETLLLRPARSSQDVKPLAALPGTEIASAFLELSPDQQWTLLSTFWARLRVPAMASALETIVGEADTKHQMLRDIAMQRLYELDSDAAKPYILEEIRHPHVDNNMGTVKPRTLAVLPQETLPELDDLLVARLERRDSHTMPLDAQLIARYSTKAILPRVKSLYETTPGRWDCVTEDGFVLYFLRTEPAYGVQRLAAAPSFCMTESIPVVMKMKRWGEIESKVITQLDNPDLNRARQAAETLARYGGATYTPTSVAEMWTAILNKNTASFQCVLSKFPMGERTLVPDTIWTTVQRGASLVAELLAKYPLRSLTPVAITPATRLVPENARGPSSDRQRSPANCDENH